MSTTHWHIASGLIGYGPDSADDYVTVDSATDAANCAHDELGTWVDIAHESADSLAESAHKEYARGMRDDSASNISALELYRGSRLESERAESLTILAMNLDSDHRARAPLYVDDPSALESTMRAIIDGYTDTAGNVHSGAPWDVSENSRLYVWECNETECREDDGE